MTSQEIVKKLREIINFLELSNEEIANLLEKRQKTMRMQ